MSNKLRHNMNPYRGFTWILAVLILLFGASLAGVASYVVNRFVINDTVDLTRRAIHEHLAGLTALGAMFSQEAPEENEDQEEYTTGHDHSSMTGMAMGNTFSKDGLSVLSAGSANSTQAIPADYDSLKQTVKYHFNLYDIENVRFYNPNGIVNFSYDKNEIGLYGGPMQNTDFQKALQGKAVYHRVSGHVLHLMFPVSLHSEEGTSGIIEITRDITAQDALGRTVILNLLGVILAGMAVLFFSLRQVFIRSTRTIDLQNRELAELLSAIERTYDQSLHALSSALDSRDNETQGHSYRVTAYAVRLGKQMKLSSKELDELARGALLHDVGKIGVPDAVLLKPDKLTDEEYAKMKTHVNLGYQMLNHIEFLSSSLSVVQYHHERWDGAGYPNRLQGEEIPLYARIFSLCDTYDAITSDRPYRRGADYALARAEIIRCRGAQFSPDVVDAFLTIPEYEWTAIRRTNKVEALVGGSSGFEPESAETRAS